LQLTAFVSMNPDRHLEAHLRYFVDVASGHDDAAAAHRKFYDEYNAVLDIPAEYYLETVRLVFQEFALAKGGWRVRFEGREIHVDPGAIRDTALLTVEGELDDIAGLGQTQAAHDLCSGLPDGMKRHLVCQGAGHYGIFSGRRWREQIYPEVRSFIRQQRPEIRG
jgi:poly(3-hydroxybutyrate) depolymerase